MYPGINWQAIQDRVFPSTSRFRNVNVTIAQFVSFLLPYVFTAAGILLLLYFLYGGFMYMTSRGDPKGIQAAQAILTNALIGFIIIFVAYWIAGLAGLLLGVPTISDIFR